MVPLGINSKCILSGLGGIEPLCLPIDSFVTHSYGCDLVNPLLYAVGCIRLADLNMVTVSLVPSRVLTSATSSLVVSVKTASIQYYIITYPEAQALCKKVMQSFI